MESKLKKIREAIHDDFLVKKDDRWSRFHLKERDRATCKSVVLKRQTGVKTVVIELDRQGKDIHPLFSTEKGIKKLKIKNDYLIFSLKEKKLYALLIELKSGNSGKWIKQCKAGEVITKYILGMVNNWAKSTVFDINNFNFRYILFHTNETENTGGVENNSLKNKRKKRTKTSSAEYIKDESGFLYIRKTCNKEYSLGMFCK